MPQDLSKFDITNQKYGKLTAEKYLSGVNSRALWQCRCECGREKVVLYRDLVYGKTKSCGCGRGRAKDLTGQHFGRLTAVAPTGEKKGDSYLWRCKCDCGKEILATAAALSKGQVHSCGCLADEAKRARFVDLTGQRFGRLTVLKPTDSRYTTGFVVWRCRCDCGKEILQPGNALRDGRTVSCGCKKLENDVLQRKLDYIDGTCIQFITNTDKLNVRNTSGHRGVQQVGQKWRAYIGFKKKKYNLGTYSTLQEAVTVRKKAEGILFGEFLDWYYDTFPERLKKTENSK